MIPLPSEQATQTSTIVTALLTTLGAGGLAKIVTQFMAGKTAVRAELLSRVRHLEEENAGLHREIADLRETIGELRGQLAVMRAKYEDRDEDT